MQANLLFVFTYSSIACSLLRRSSIDIGSHRFFIVISKLIAFSFSSCIVLKRINLKVRFYYFLLERLTRSSVLSIIKIAITNGANMEFFNDLTKESHLCKDKIKVSKVIAI